MSTMPEIRPHVTSVERETSLVSGCQSEQTRFRFHQVTQTPNKKQNTDSAGKLTKVTGTGKFRFQSSQTQGHVDT